VAAERARADAMWHAWSADQSQAPPNAILLHSLRKVFPSRDGNKEKVAVQVRRGGWWVVGGGVGGRLLFCLGVRWRPFYCAIHMPQMLLSAHRMDAFGEICVGGDVPQCGCWAA
jgi:hypothetical protein